MQHLPPDENRTRMLAGDFYHANVPSLDAERTRALIAQDRFNDARNVSRRQRVELWRDLVQDLRPLPPKLDNEEEDAAQFDTTDPYVIAPIKVDYGTQVKVAPGTFVNAGATFIDTCDIVIGPRVLLAPNVSFFSGTHPLDPAVRDGLSGPEMGGKIVIEEDCWIGGSAIILPGITVGRGSTVGAGSVVTKNVPPFHVVAGNPARVIRKIETEMDPSQKKTGEHDKVHGAEAPMAELAIADEKK